MSSEPVAVFTNSDSSLESLESHLFRTVTGALAQCVANAVNTPVSATPRMLLYALGTSNSATSWIVVPS